MASHSARAQWDCIRSDSDPLRWLLTTSNATVSDLTYTASGTGGFSEMMAALKGMEGIIFGGVRVAAVDDRGSIMSIRPKFIKFFLMTDSVGGLKRAKAANLAPIAEEIFYSSHIAFNLNDADDLTPKEIERKLQASGGAHLPNRYDFEGVDDVVIAAQKGSTGPTTSSAASSPTSPAAPQAKPVVEEAKPVVEEAKPVVEEAKPVVEEAKPVVEEAKPVVEEAKPVVEEAKPVVEEAKPAAQTAPKSAPAPPPTNLSIQDAWDRVQSSKYPENFIVVSCDGKSEASAKIEVMAKGGLEDFKDAFEDDMVMFGGFRLRAIDDRGSVTSVRPKSVFVSYIGPCVKPMVRAQAGTIRARFESLMSGCHISLSISNPQEDIVEADIKSKLLNSGGAHSPNKFDFSGCKEESA